MGADSSYAGGERLSRVLAPLGTHARFVRFAIFIAVMAVCSSLKGASSAEEFRRAMANLRSDRVPHNCQRATTWLLKHREEVKDDLLAELYRADYQARDAIFHVLLNTPSFQPDERFIRFLLARLPEQNKHVWSGMIFEDAADRMAGSGVHWEAWTYMKDHFELFDPYLK